MLGRTQASTSRHRRCEHADGILARSQPRSYLLSQIGSPCPVLRLRSQEMVGAQKNTAGRNGRSRGCTAENERTAARYAHAAIETKGAARAAARQQTSGQQTARRGMLSDRAATTAICGRAVSVGLAERLAAR